MDELTYEMILKSWKESAKISEASENKELDMQCKEMVERAIEKQIPKKPVDFTGRYKGNYCPRCRNKVDEYIDSYCTECGQKLCY